MNNSVDEKSQEEFDLALMILGASKGDMNDQYELANAYKKVLLCFYMRTAMLMRKHYYAFT